MRSHCHKIFLLEGKSSLAGYNFATILFYSADPLLLDFFLSSQNPVCRIWLFSGVGEFSIVGVSDISLAEFICIILCGALSIINLGIFTENIFFVRKCYDTSSSVIFKSTIILGLYPAMTVFSLCAVCLPKAFLVCNLCASVYISIGMYCFMALLFDYFGGLRALLMQVTEKPVSLCCCIPLKVTRKTLISIQICVAQNAVLQMVISFLSVVLWLDEKYVAREVRVDNAFIYLSALRVISTVVGINGVRLIVNICQAIYEPLNIKAKSRVLIFVLFFHNIQGFLFNILATNNIPECTKDYPSEVRGRAWNNMIIIVEMFLLGVLARCLYRKPHADIYLPTSNEVLQFSSKPDIASERSGTGTGSTDGNGNLNSSSINLERM